eukprot:m.31835 g.31835  ORF g.31835 m.31835 type:complete len:369 (+) comp8351_c0_seq3:71-1177(+)
MESEDKVCGLCRLQIAKYTCPRCMVPYCALSCYRGEAHAGCSEDFYKQEFMENLNTRATSDEKRKMASMLKAFEEEQAAEAEEVDDIEGEYSLEERLQGLDLDNSDDLDTVWERLTEQEKSKFKELISGKDLSPYIEVWHPWWCQDNNCGACVCSSEENVHLPTSAVKPGPTPEIHLKDVPDIKTLLRGKEPAKEMVNNLVNVLFAYAYVLRRFNGEILAQDVVQDCISFFETTSGVLGQAVIYDSVSLAISSAVVQVETVSKLRMGDNITTEIVLDVTCILDNVEFVQIALGHTYKMFKKGKRKDVARKLWFYLSWWTSIKDQTNMWDTVKEQVRMEFVALKDKFKEHEVAQDKFEASRKTLIQEMD